MRFVLVVAVLLAGSGLGQEVTTLNGDKTKMTVTFESNPKRGEQIYKTYCHHCHGEKGDGSGHIGRGLQVKPIDLTAPELASRMTTDTIARIVRDGSGKPNAAMIPWGTVLRDEQIRDVAAYTATLAADGRAQREKQQKSDPTKKRP